MILLLVLVVLYLTYRSWRPSENILPAGRYVLISGCDSGIGYALAIDLDKHGWNVLAGVLRTESIALLESQLSSGSKVFRLDITKQEDIDAAYDLVVQTTRYLHALVNNAGILTHGGIDWTSMEAMRRIMDVNFFGHVAMTKRFLPLLIGKRDSRVVNVVSAAGFFTFPNTSAYSASKHALESFSDCLRREMAPWNLRVSIIEPGALRTTMLDGYEATLRDVWNGLTIDVQERWGVEYLNSIIQQAITSAFVIHADDPSRVVGAIEHAVMSTRPRLYYRPGWQAKLFFFVLYLSPTWLSDRLIATVFNFIPRGVEHQLS